MKQYRGLTKDGKWVYGTIALCENDELFIIGKVVESCEEYISFEFWQPVIPETVGRSTGFKDNKNDKEIYEGDIVIVERKYGEYTDDLMRPTKCVVTLTDYSCDFVFGEEEICMELTCQNCREVIGNIHQNPDLIEKK